MTIPVVISFDKNFILPAKIAIYSLLVNAHETTEYEIYVLTSDRSVALLFDIDSLKNVFSNFTVQYIYVGSVFNDAYEVRDITIAAYYRLLIPEFLPHCKKVIYMDVDVIVQSDLSKIYQIDLGENFVAGFLDYGISSTEKGQKYLKETLHINTQKYIQSGFLLMNLDKFRSLGLCDKMRTLVKHKYVLQDMDVLNIACVGKTYVLPCYLNVVLQFYDMLRDYRNDYRGIDLQSILNTSIIHYNGKKPWNGSTMNDDIWWYYYRKSPFFDIEFYCQHQFRKYYVKECLFKKGVHFIKKIIGKLSK